MLYSANTSLISSVDTVESVAGDRRQELVFIGQFGKDSGSSRKALEEVLDSCLLTPAEMVDYETVAPKGDDALRALFFPPNKN